jgi:hypothetical protein
MIFQQSIISTFPSLMKNLITSQLIKYIQAFEHFIDLFEIEHDDVITREFSQSLQANSKGWFRHLQPVSISSWEEMSEIFLNF